MMPAPEQAQYDEFGRPLVHPIAAAIQDAYKMPPPVSGGQAPAPSPSQSISVNPPQSIPPAQPTPTENAIKALPVPASTDPAYKNSKWMTLLNAIAGGFAGAAGHPEVGKELHDTKYNRAMQDYKNKLGSLQTSSEVEQGQQGRGEKAFSLQTSRIGAENKAESAAESNKIKEEAQQTARFREEDYKKNLEGLEKQRQAHEAQLKGLTEKQASINKALAAIRDETDPVKKEKLLKDFHDLYTPPKETPEQAAAKAAAVQEARDKQALTSTGQQANISRSAGRVIGTGTPAALSAEAAVSGAKAKATEEAKTTPEMIQRQAELQRAKSLATLSMNEKDVARKAQIALQAMPDVRSQVDAASDSLFVDRWKNFRTGTLGTEDSQKYAALRANVELLQTLVSQVHTGNRGISKILDKFSNMFNVDKMNKKTFIDSINEVEKWLKRYAELPKVGAGYDLGDVDKLVAAPGSTGKYGVIQVYK